MAATEWQRGSGPVKKIAVLEPNPQGGYSAHVVYDQKASRKKKKGLRVLKGPEKLVRRLAEAQSTLVDVYLRRHSRANRKKKDGWLRDLGINLIRANQKAAKKVRLGRLI